MENSNNVERFDVPSKTTALETYRAFRKYLEASVGHPLSKGWYEDGPDQKPYLYEDQPPRET